MSSNLTPQWALLAPGFENPDHPANLEKTLAALKTFKGQDLSRRQQREHRALASRVFLWRLGLLGVQRRGDTL